MSPTIILRNIFYGVSFISILAFAACTPNAMDVPIETSYESFDGDLKSLGGVRVNKTITHLFENEEGEIFYAYSDKYDLNDPMYSGKKLTAYGLVSSYEGLDKSTFEIRTLDIVKNIYSLYQDSDLGFSLESPSAWIAESTENGVQWMAISSSATPGDENTGMQSLMKIAEFVVHKTSSVQEFALDEDSIVAKEEYEPLQISRHLTGSIWDGVAYEVVSVGPNKLLALKYSGSTSDAYTPKKAYFMLRDSELIELSFFVDDSSLDPSSKLQYGKHFSHMLSTFTVSPENEAVEEKLSVTEDSSPEEAAEVEKTVDQVKVSSYREFESSPFNFIISYPAAWYYSGGGGGYDFSDKPLLEEGASPIIRMDLKSSEKAGVLRNGDEFRIIFALEDKMYSLYGPLEYEEIMQTMADSIRPADEESS